MRSPYLCLCVFSVFDPVTDFRTTLWHYMALRGTTWHLKEVARLLIFIISNINMADARKYEGDHTLKIYSKVLNLWVSM